MTPLTECLPSAFEGDLVCLPPLHDFSGFSQLFPSTGGERWQSLDAESAYFSINPCKAFQNVPRVFAYDCASLEDRRKASTIPSCERSSVVGAQLSSRVAAFDTPVWSIKNPLTRARSDPIRLASAPMVFTRDLKSPGRDPVNEVTGMPQHTLGSRFLLCSLIMNCTLDLLQVVMPP